MDPVAQLALSLAAIVGTLAFVLCCLLGLTRRAWLFLRGVRPPPDRERPTRHGFDVLPARRDVNDGTERARTDVANDPTWAKIEADA